MRMGTRGTIAAVGALALCASLQGLDAQATRSYTWYAELAAIDQNAKTVTIKVQIRDGVTQYVGSYKPGDKLMLTWVPITGEADTVIYAPKYDVMKGIDEGFILPVEFVAADPRNHSLTVRAAAPPTVLQSLQTVQAGRWIKVVAPMRQPTDVAVLTSATPAAKPDLKPPAPPPAPAGPAAGRGRGRGGPPPAAGAPASGAGAAGTWAVSAQIAGNELPSECVFAVQDAKLTGTCSGQLGQGEVSGEVAGTSVKFRYTVSFSGMSLDLAYAGSLDAAGTTMLGTVTVFGMSGDFSATKK